MSAAILLFFAQRWTGLFSDRRELIALILADWRRLRGHPTTLVALVMLIVAGLGGDGDARSRRFDEPEKDLLELLADVLV